MISKDWEHVCTKDNPWHLGIKGRSTHPDCYEVDEPANDYVVTYKCPHCGLVFEIELPE